MSRDASSKKSRPSQPARKAKPTSAAAAPAPKPAGWFERLKRLRLRFQRKGVSIHVMLEDPAVQIAQTRREAAAADTSEAALLSGALKSVLDRHPSSRAVLVHLGALEKSLSRHGLKVLDELPPDLMRRALQQLDTLVADWSPAALAALRAKLKTSLHKRERVTDRRSTAERLSDFNDDNKMHVGEASVTTFMEANEQWERSLTGQNLQAAVR